MKKSKTEILNILRQINKYIKEENRLSELTKDLRKRDGEYYFYDDYYSLNDMIYLIFTGEHREDRESKFACPAMPKSGQVIAWIYRDKSWMGGFRYDEFDSNLMASKKFYNRTGYIGDIITDIVFDKKIKPETKYEMLKKFFKLQDRLLKTAKKIP